MRTQKRIQINLLTAIGIVFFLANSCKKDESIVIKDPKINWANPADITVGTLLSATQLNAIANVAGTYIYTPPIGTSLSLGANQDLKVDFTPTDVTNYNTVSKTVKINVIIATVTDFDGNVYNTITIGTKILMKENLKTTNFSNGTSIPLVTDTNNWIALTDTSKAYCWYNNDTANKTTYGALYTWAAAMNGAASTTDNPSSIQGVCPTGWHLPSDAEWSQMENYLADNGYNYDGTTGGGRDKIAKSLASTSGWTSSSNTGAVGNTDYPTYRNKSDFTALPGGYRTYVGTFLGIGDYSIWWSATEYDATDGTDAWCHYLHYSISYVRNSGSFKDGGYYVRCVRN
jgi:uncharacterized protein (TIGR02145 family)